MPPFVLVHGAFHGGWCWAPVAKALRERGHPVFTPTLTGLGERSHLLSSHISMETWVRDVLNVLKFEDLENVVLVGHSFGARPVCGVADRARQRIRRLIFIDGGLPLDGLSKLDALSPEARAARIATSTDGGISIPVPPVAYFGIADPAIAGWVARHLTPQPLGAERTALRLDRPPGNGVPATYVKCTDPPHASVAPGAAYAQSQKEWRYIELKAGHDCIVTDPEPVVEILLAESAL